MASVSSPPAANPPIAYRHRRDLKFSAIELNGGTFWVAKDPLARAYYRFDEEEYAIYHSLNGRRDAETICAEFEKQFYPQLLPKEELRQFVASLVSKGLLLSDAPGVQIPPRPKNPLGLLGITGKIFAWRLPGIQPDRFLDVAYPWIRWVFSKTIQRLYVCLLVAAFAWVVVHWEAFISRLPSLHEWFTPSNAIWMVLTLAATKVLHELGHAFTCKHYGGDVHEIGVMFLCFAPCLYCDTSDSWMLSSKWQRARIGAAGMVIEMGLAAAATFLWWFSEPSLFHQLCLNVMMIGSVNTLLINGNPLLRYDGYYIASDLFEIPNLRTQAQQAVRSTLAKCCLGWPPPGKEETKPASRFLVGFGMISAVYRWMVAFGIAWFVHEIFKPYRLEILGTILAGLALSGMIFSLLTPLWVAIRHPERIGQVNGFRVMVTLFLLGFAGWGAWNIPLPYRVVAPLALEPRDEQPVYIRTRGTLEQLHVRPGDQVSEGTTLASLHNPLLETEVSELTQQVNRQQTFVENLHGQRFADPRVAHRIPAAMESLQDLQSRLAKKQKDLERLILKAPSAGVILPPENIHKQGNEDDKSLGVWSGVPLAENNLGATFDAGSLFCLLGEPGSVSALLLVDQQEIEFIRAKQMVEIYLDGWPGRVFRGRVESISEVDLETIPKQLSNKSGGNLATHTDRHGRERPLETLYQVRVPLQSKEASLCPGQRGRAKIIVPPQTLAQQTSRWLARTFHFRW
ncbi:HlyD family efflux transporter periplasmic adaptor subunit [Planctomycetales bacterium 10988]|nr:HlyD family efflux transporter periplasmic adaptor subunit [Planctomycetales bacterium 10988]